MRAELETGRLRQVRLPGLEITRHFHVIHNEARAMTARGRAFMAALQAEGSAAMSRTRKR